MGVPRANERIPTSTSTGISTVDDRRRQRSWQVSAAENGPGDPRSRARPTPNVGSRRGTLNAMHRLGNQVPAFGTPGDIEADGEVPVRRVTAIR